MGWNVEERLLLRCCRTLVCGSKRLNTSDFPAEIDWPIFLLKAKREGIAPFLYKRFVGQLDNESIPAWLIGELKKDYYAVIAKNAVVFEELKKVLNVLTHAGLQTMVLKGAVLAEKIYNDLGVRPMSDVDLLIKGEDLVAIDQALRSLGYRSDDMGSIDPGAVPTDYLMSVVYYSPAVYYVCFHLHWHTVNSTIPNKTLIDYFDMDDIWRDAEKVTLAGCETMVMAPHHLLIHLAEHGLRVTHSLSKLSFLCDINETIAVYEEEMDWDKLVEESIKFKIDRFVYLSLALTVELLGSRVPGKVLKLLRPGRRRLFEIVFQYCVANNFRLAGLSYLLYFSNNKGFFSKLNFIFRTLFPPRQVVAQRRAILLEDTGKSLYVKRVIEVLLNCFGVLGRVLLFLRPGK